MEATQIASVQDCRVILFVPIEDAPVHTAKNGYHCNDKTCPCNEQQEDYAERDTDDEEAFLRAYGNAESSSQLPWNRNQTEEYAELAEHAPYCDCPACSGEPDDYYQKSPNHLAEPLPETTITD